MNIQKWNFRKFSIAVTAALTVALTMGTAQSADAELVTVVDAVELSASNIILPRTVNGMVSFRACSGYCDREYQRARLTPQTRFLVGERAVKYSDFQQSIGSVNNADKHYALLSVDKKTITITSIRIEG